MLENSRFCTYIFDMRAKYEPPKKIENYKSSSFDELNKQGRINSILWGL